MKSNTEPILIAVFISLAVHVIVLSILVWLREGDFFDEPDNQPVEVAMVEMTPEMLAMLDQPPALPVSADLQNLTQNLDRPTDALPSNYVPPASGNLSESVANELSQFEQDVFNELAQDHQEVETTESTLERDEGGRYDDIVNANPEGNVTTSFSLKDRDLIYGPKPSYRCRVSGKVKIDIVVGQDGKVLSATVNDAGTNTSSACLLEESLRYAERWIFRSKMSAPKRQEGFITFTFLAQ